MRIDFDAVVFRWDARVDSSWFFAAVPPDLSAEVRELHGDHARGFGSLRVEATIGDSTWRTSIFPGSDGRYVLPLKRAVREKQELHEDGPVSVSLEVLGG